MSLQKRRDDDNQPQQNPVANQLVQLEEEDNPMQSIRRNAKKLNSGKQTTNEILRNDLQKEPYQSHRGQELTEDHKNQGLVFCQWILQNIIDLHKIIFTDEHWFHLHPHPNRQNTNIWRVKSHVCVTTVWNKELKRWCAGHTILHPSLPVAILLFSKRSCVLKLKQFHIVGSIIIKNIALHATLLRSASTFSSQKCKCMWSVVVPIVRGQRTVLTNLYWLLVLEWNGRWGCSIKNSKHRAISRRLTSKELQQLRKVECSKKWTQYAAVLFSGEKNDWHFEAELQS